MEGKVRYHKKQFIRKIIRDIFIIFLILFFRCATLAELLINEIACATSGEDWVELFFHSEDRTKIDISQFYVTMYYGLEERLGTDSISIYSYNRPETPYDDRFVVVHLTEQNKADETDLTGDTNLNGYIDVYCNNYYSSLWNTDCVVAVDSDNASSNGGMIDFAAYSNRDGSPNENMVTYVEDAQAFNQWSAYSGDNIQECMIDIGEDGLSSYMSISRKNSSDTNSKEDFEITKYVTPGRENILSSAISSRAKLFSVSKKRITIIPTHPILGKCDIELFIYEQCNIRLRIFSDIGMLLYESPLYANISPGNLILNWNLSGKRRRAATGLYIGHIEATSRSLKQSEVEKIYLILSHYK